MKRAGEKKDGFYGKSLSLKLLSMFLFTLLISLSISFLLHFMFFQPYYLDQYERRLLLIVDEIEVNLDSEVLSDVIVEIDYSQQVDVIIADSDLRNVVRSNNQHNFTAQRLEQEMHNIITQDRELLKTSHVLITTSGETAPPRLIFIKQLSDGRYCILTHPWEPLENNITAIAEFHYLIGAVACFVGVVMTLFFSRQFTKPIIEISKVTESLSQLDFQQKIAYRSEDELGHLATSINTLSKKLDENRIALKNEVDFQKVLSQNMSHELKTPISVMKGYLEGVVRGFITEEETKQEYLEIVLEECDRMTSLIDRMLHLSKLTSFQERGLEREAFSSTIFSKNLQSHCGGLLQKNQLTLEEEIETVNLFGNQELLVQAMGNFVTNAVKYGDKKTLRLRIRAHENCHLISLYNSGRLVPEEEREKIFNVFYMLDKARSRNLNSHGLGLTVCKTIADLHHGQAFCREEEDGMEFILQIPKI